MAEPIPDQSDAPAEKRRRGRPGYDHATVLRRAIELFNRQGYDGTSMGDLAKELGFTKSAIYHHVPSKEYLLSEALDEALSSLDEAIDNAQSLTDASPDVRLRAAVRGSVEALCAHRPAVTLLLRVHGNSPVELEALRRRREIDLRLAGLVTAAVDDGTVRDDIPPELTSRLLFGMVNSLIEWVRPESRYVDQITDALISIAFYGLQVR